MTLFCRPMYPGSNVRDGGTSLYVFRRQPQGSADHSSCTLSGPLIQRRICRLFHPSRQSAAFDHVSARYRIGVASARGRPASICRCGYRIFSASGSFLTSPPTVKQAGRQISDASASLSSGCQATLLSPSETSTKIGPWKTYTA